MAKKLEMKETEVPTSLSGGISKNEFTNMALSVVYNGNKRYSVVGIKFNPGSSEHPTVASSIVEIIESNLDLYEAQHVFKTQTVKAGLFDEGLDKI